MYRRRRPDRDEILDRLLDEFENHGGVLPPHAVWWGMERLGVGEQRLGSLFEAHLRALERTAPPFEVSIRAALKVRGGANFLEAWTVLALAEEAATVPRVAIVVRALRRVPVRILSPLLERQAAWEERLISGTEDGPYACARCRDEASVRVTQLELFARQGMEVVA